MPLLARTTLPLAALLAACAGSRQAATPPASASPANPTAATRPATGTEARPAAQAEARRAAQAEARPAAEAEAQAADLAFSAASVAHDAQAFMRFLAADTIFVSRTVDVGVAAVSADWAPLLAPGGPTLAWAPDFALGAGGGDLVLTRGAFILTPTSGGPPRTGRYLTIWRREPDGRLRVALDASDTPLPPESSRAVRRPLRRLVSADERLGAVAGLLLEGERPVGGFMLVEVRDGGGWRVLAEVGSYRPEAP